jgi:hypothetical protein
MVKTNVMKGIYLSQEGKKAIEDRIAELEDYTFATQDLYLEGSIKGHLYCLKEILSSATILPTQRTWESLEEDLFEDVHPDTDRAQMMYIVYPNGVIITDKKP